MGPPSQQSAWGSPNRGLGKLGSVKGPSAQILILFQGVGFRVWGPSTQHGVLGSWLSVIVVEVLKKVYVC